MVVFPHCWELNSRKDSILNAILVKAKIFEWISYLFVLEIVYKKIVSIGKFILLVYIYVV